MDDATTSPPGTGPAATGERCATCRHWRKGRATVAAGGVLTDVGECRAGPPTRDLIWPRVRGADSCGEWAARGDAAAVPARAPEPAAGRSRRARVTSQGVLPIAEGGAA